jgi:hypothetical protein
MKKERDHRVSYDILGRSPITSLVATFVGSGLSSYPHLHLLKLGVCAIECGTGVTSLRWNKRHHLELTIISHSFFRLCLATLE